MLFILIFWIAPIMIWSCLNWTEWWGRLTLGPHSALIFHNFWQKKASYNFFAKFSFSEKATKIWAKAELYQREHSHMTSSRMFLRYFWTTYLPSSDTWYMSLFSKIKFSLTYLPKNLTSYVKCECSLRMQDAFYFRL